MPDGDFAASAPEQPAAAPEHHPAGTDPPALPLIPAGGDEPVTDAGAATNTAMQFGAQLCGLVFTSALTLYLVRALGAHAYGIYSLAVSIGALAVLPAMWGLPFSISRHLAEHRDSARQVSRIYVMGLRMQIPAAVLTGVLLFTLSGPIASAYNSPGLGWPMRWIALSVIGQAMFGYLAGVSSALRRSSPGMWMALAESATETFTAIGLVLAGAGAAGAAFGKLAGYLMATILGLIIVPRVFGGVRRNVVARVRLSVASVVRYASVIFVVDITWSAIAQIDVVLIGALLSTTAVGSFGAVLRLLTVLGYVGNAVSAGVAPRLSLGGDGPDVAAFEFGLRYLLVLQGLTLAPMIVWATPVTHLLLGGSYHSAPAVMRALAVYSYVGAPAGMITIGVNYLGQSRRRLWIMVATLALGVVATYVLIELIGVVGAAVADDLVMVIYVAAHFWLCVKVVKLDLVGLTRTLLRTLLAAAAMSLVLFAVGTGLLSAVQWVFGLIGGFAAYVAVLLVSGETSLDELRAVGQRAVALVPGR